LLRRGSPEEIQSVMGHEMGHYVLHHFYKDLLFFGVLALLGFAFVNWTMHWSLARWGDRWGTREITDVAALPLAVLVFSIFSFVLTPVTNTWTRTQEYEADIFGINAARQPDGEALVDLKLGDYRKLDPRPLEEMIFFDHPSGRTRITAAMRWKVENMAVLPPGTRLEAHNEAGFNLLNKGTSHACFSYCINNQDVQFPVTCDLPYLLVTFPAQDRLNS
jgi:STE24 endopeptidase